MLKAWKIFFAITYRLARERHRDTGTQQHTVTNQNPADNSQVSLPRSLQQELLAAPRLFVQPVKEHRPDGWEGRLQGSLSLIVTQRCVRSMTQQHLNNLIQETQSEKKDNTMAENRSHVTFSASLNNQIKLKHASHMERSMEKQVMSILNYVMKSQNLWQ